MTAPPPYPLQLASPPQILAMRNPSVETLFDVSWLTGFPFLLYNKTIQDFQDY